MTLAHIHLLLNHVPTVGTIVATALLLMSLIRASDALKRVSLEVLFVIGLATLPAYLSGVGTQQVLQKASDVSLDLMARHHDAALLASIFMFLTGGAAWLALWQFRRVSRPGGVKVTAVLILAVVTIVLMARTATMGGEIRHPEMLVDPGTEVSDSAASPAEAPEAAPGVLTAAFVASLVTDHVWLWPASEALHFIGLGLLFGVVLLVNLRMLGMMKNVPFAALHRLLPWGVLGLGVNTITGMLFVIGTPEQYAQNVAFYWKMGLLLLAGANLLYLTSFEGPWNVGAGDEAPMRVKAMAASAIALWVGVMYFGRMLPFIGNAF